MLHPFSVSMLRIDGCVSEAPSEAHVKCTRVCKHFKLVFRCAAVDCRSLSKASEASFNCKKADAPPLSLLHVRRVHFSCRLSFPYDFAYLSELVHRAHSLFHSYVRRPSTVPPSCTFDPTLDRSSCVRFLPDLTLSLHTPTEVRERARDILGETCALLQARATSGYFVFRDRQRVLEFLKSISIIAVTLNANFVKL